MAVTTLAEIACWAASWWAGFAPLPWLGTYLLLCTMGLGGAAVVGRLFRRLDRRPWRAAIAGTLMVAVGASLFLPLKFALPEEVPFWLDGPLATAEQSLFGVDPWRVLDSCLAWATIPLDRIYGLWLPVQTLVLFSVMLATPSRAKSHAMTAYSLAWFLLGVVAALLFASAGPLFFERLSGGQAFSGLGAAMRARGAVMTLAESNLMWSAYTSGQPGLVSGISALPSLHVAISLWIYLVSRSLLPRAAPLALGYVVIIFLGSVQLGWHYVSDGLAGLAGMLAIWALARPLEAIAARTSAAE